MLTVTLQLSKMASDEEVTAALDEAAGFREGSTIVNLLESRLDRMPRWLRMIATTRNDKRFRDA